MREKPFAFDTGDIEVTVDGTYRSSRNYAVGASPVSMVAADMNGDGKPDLLVANGQDGTVSVLLNLRCP